MKKRNSLTQVVPVAAMLVMLLLSGAAFAGTEIDNEYWISASTNTAGLGTLDNPFDASTQLKFDTIMSNLPACSTIHLLAGTYQTEGWNTWQIKSGQKLLGSGINVTIIQLTNASPGTVVMGCAPPANTTNIEVADLTVDCDPTVVAGNYAGIDIVGNHAIVRRVKVIHCAALSQEEWAISLSGLNDLIEDCLVTDFATAGCDGMQIGGSAFTFGSGTIRGNQIIGDINQEEIGINGSFVNGYLVKDNFIYGIQTAFYNDTGGQTNVIITDNIFKNVRGGIGYAGGGGYTKQNITISDNTIMLTTNNVIAWNGVQAIGITYYATNMNIIGNIVGWYNPPSPDYVGYGHFLGMGPGDGGIVVANNRVESSFVNSYDGSSGLPAGSIIAFNNYDLKGNWLANLGQLLPNPSAQTQWLPLFRGDGTAPVYFDLLPGWLGNVGGAWWGYAARPSIMSGSLTNLTFSVSFLTTNAGTFTFHLRFEGSDGVNQFYSSGWWFATNFVSQPGTNINTISFNSSWADATNPWTILSAYAWMNGNMNNTNVVFTGGSFSAY